VKRAIVVPVLVIAALVLTSSTSGAISNEEAGKQYLKDVASANAALETFGSEIDAWTNATSDSEGQRQAASALAALVTLRKNFLSQTWPRSVEGRVRYIGEEDISLLEENLRMIGYTALGNGTFQFAFGAISKTLDSDAFYVRKDLGLPRSRAL
jgi:hypothetical protein